MLEQVEPSLCARVVVPSVLSEGDGVPPPAIAAGRGGGSGQSHSQGLTSGQLNERSAHRGQRGRSVTHQRGGARLLLWVFLVV